MLASGSRRERSASRPSYARRAAAAATIGRVSLLLLVDLDGVVYRGAGARAGRRRRARRPRGQGRRRRLRDEQLDALPGRLRHAPRGDGRAGHGRDRRLVGAGDGAPHRRSRAGRSAACSSLGASGLERELRDVGLDVVTAGHAATRMHQEGIDGCAAAGAPGRGRDRPRPEPDLPAARGGRRLHPRRRPVHRHEPRPGLPDRARPPAGRRQHRRRRRGHDRVDAARRSASPSRTCSSSRPRRSGATPGRR